MKLVGRHGRIVEMAQAGLSNATIAARLNVRAKTIREQIARARKLGADIPLNSERIAREQSRRGLHLQPMSDAEIARLARAAEARGLGVEDFLNRMIRELLSPASFPALIDNILDDGVST